MSKWSDLLTEQRNPASARIDEVDTAEMLAIINNEDARVAPAVGAQLPAIARAVDATAAALAQGGRLFYLGAGTSGRLGILDASECPPTYGTDPALVQGLIAGGQPAVFSAVEGAEDDRQGAAADLEAKALGPEDIVMGIAASGVTPYVLGGLAYARDLGCTTVFFTCSPAAAAAVEVDIKIVPEVGPEVVTGSTRMKAGTATKLVLNMLTTGAMIRLGKTYGNLMVDLQPKNAKLKDRSCRILAALTQLDRDQAEEQLAAAGWDLKLALVLQLCDLEPEEGRRRLKEAGGSVKRVVQQTPPST